MSKRITILMICLSWLFAVAGHAERNEKSPPFVSREEINFAQNISYHFIKAYVGLHYMETLLRLKKLEEAEK